MPRLPVPGSDEGTWGEILNDFLSSQHNGDGSHNITLGDLDGVNLSAPITGQVIKFNGTNWVNDTDLVGSGGTNLAYSASTNTVSSDTGTDAILPTAVASGDDGLLSGTDKLKIDRVVLYEGSTWPSRPLTGEFVVWIGPSDPPDSIDGDVWIDTA